MKRNVERQERGWAGHFILGDRCRFRRNTLLTCGNIRIVVSTVGLVPDALNTSGTKFMELGYNRYYETMAFHSNPADTRYHDIDVGRGVHFESPWAISEVDADDRANEMHERVVAEITEGLSRGNTYE